MRIPAVFGVLLALSLASCTTPEEGRSGHSSRFIYPNARFTHTATNSPMQFPNVQFESRTAFEHWVVEVAGPDQLQIIQDDPFQTGERVTVLFETTDTGEEIANYYELLFRRDGWHLEREHLLTEDSGIVGTDWGRVYRKGSVYVRVQVFGFWRRNRVFERDDPGGRIIGLSFIGTTPEDILGADFKNAPKSTASDDRLPASSPTPR